MECENEKNFSNNLETGEIKYEKCKLDLFVDSSTLNIYLFTAWILKYGRQLSRRNLHK